MTKINEKLEDALLEALTASNKAFGTSANVRGNTDQLTKKLAQAADLIRQALNELY